MYFTNLAFSLETIWLLKTIYCATFNLKTVVPFSANSSSFRCSPKRAPLLLVCPIYTFLQPAQELFYILDLTL